ncbi:MAG TPA: hypothetical protein VM925_00465 [Labilithrix sp.]|nr:hypothetical protein [Labilithrix sp.]
MKMGGFGLRILGAASLVIAVAVACGSIPDGGRPQADRSKDGGKSPGAFGDGGVADDGASGPLEDRDPVDCEEATRTKSYVGCDYWPTITPNGVGSTYSFAAVVANTGTNPADVEVTGPNAFHAQLSVAPGQLGTIELPWVEALKSGYGNGGYYPNSVMVAGGAYHLVSSRPVIVYQFNPLQYRVDGGANSATNDASLLLPSTAMTGNYRVTGMHSVSDLSLKAAPIVTITATAPNTAVKVKLAPSASVVGANGIPEASGGSILELTLAGAGDVVHLAPPAPGSNPPRVDFSGSVLQASRPVQVMTSMPCVNIPDNARFCDHIEESVFPAETFGKEYVVTSPTGIHGDAVSQLVRIYGSQDGTKLTYTPSKPGSCPDHVDAGQVAECGIVDTSFVVSGSAEFAVRSFLLGAMYYRGGLNNPTLMGDPSETGHPAVEQFRKNYVFLAPSDYPRAWADVAAPEGTTLTLDGFPVTKAWEKIGSGYGVVRLDLTQTGSNGAHSLVASKPVGVQIIGYGDATSFQYPAGLNLKLIASPPVLK